MGVGAFVTRWWNSVKPLPEDAERRARVSPQKRRQRRLMLWTAVILLLAGVGWYAFNYVNSAPERANAQLEAGMRQMQPGSYREAIARFDRALSIAPQLADAYFERGVARHLLGESAAALADLDQALELNPDLAGAHNERGSIYRQQGDAQKAIGELSKSIQGRATTDGYYQRGQAYESLGQHQKAIDDYDQAVAQMREAPYVYRARAVAKDKIGDSEGAKQDRVKADGIEAAH
jgi:tetratricopeptide (TPR) repeat protein